MLMLGVSVIYYVYHESLIGLFSQDANVISIGGEWIRILSYSYFVYGWWMVSSKAFNGSGDPITPTKINFVFFWLIQIPLAYYLAIPADWQHIPGYFGQFSCQRPRPHYLLSGFLREESGKPQPCDIINSRKHIKYGKHAPWNKVLIK